MVIGILVLPYLVFFFSLHSVMYNERFYDQQFAENGAYSIFEKETVMQETRHLLNVYRSGKPLTTKFFNEKEKMHISEVNNIYQQAKKIVYKSVAVLLLIISLLHKKERAAVMLMRGSLVTLGLILIITLAITTDFTASFTAFHKLLFINENWMLNPATDNLIILFPESFFVAFVTTILKNTALTALLCLGIGKALNSRSTC